MLHWMSLLLLLLLPACCWGQLTEDEKQETLKFINHLRRNVVPRAADMNGVFWDDNLAQLAQSAADKCIFQHNYNGPYAGLGENVYKGGRRNFSEIFMFMFLERENFDFKSSRCNINSGSKYPMFKTCGHYLQLVSAHVTRMGCGIKRCPDGNNIAFCEYNMGVMQPPYEAGEPGTKCKHLWATYSQNGLCYNWRYPDPLPISGQLDCRITCLNYGNQSYNHYQCACRCPLGFYGMRCELRTGYKTTIPNDCTAQLVHCKNGGTPTMDGDRCKCVCPANYRGDACEENIAQTENSVFWYFGEEMMYSSYYPVDPQILTSKYVLISLQWHLTAELNTYCKTNYATCCPNGGNATSSENIVHYEELLLTDNYPQNTLDGLLKIGVHYRMQDAVASTCRGPSAPYMNRNAVLAVAAKATDIIKGLLIQLGVTTIEYE